MLESHVVQAASEASDGVILRAIPLAKRCRASGTLEFAESVHAHPHPFEARAAAEVG